VLDTSPTNFQTNKPLMSSNIFNHPESFLQNQQGQNSKSSSTKRNEIHGLLSPSEMLMNKPPPLDIIFKNILQNQPGGHQEKQSDNHFPFPLNLQDSKTKENYFDTSKIKIDEVHEIKDSHDVSLNVMKNFENFNHSSQRQNSLPMPKQTEKEFPSDRLENMFLSFGDSSQMRSSLSEILKPTIQQPQIYKPQQSVIYSSNESNYRPPQNSGSFNLNSQQQNYRQPTFQQQQQQQYPPNRNNSFSYSRPSYPQNFQNQYFTTTPYGVTPQQSTQQQFSSNPMMMNSQYNSRYPSQNSVYGIQQSYQNPYTTNNNGYSMYQSSTQSTNSNAPQRYSNSSNSTSNLSSYSSYQESRLNNYKRESQQNSSPSSNHRRSIENEKIDRKKVSTRKPMVIVEKEKRKPPTKRNPLPPRNNKRSVRNKKITSEDGIIREDEKELTEDEMEAIHSDSSSESEDEILENSSNFSFSNLSLKMFSQTAFRYESYMKLMKDEIKERILTLVPEKERKSKEKEIESLCSDPLIELNVYNSVCQTPVKKKKPIGMNVYEIIDINDFHLTSQKVETKVKKEKEEKIEKKENLKLFQELSNISDVKLDILMKPIPFEIKENKEENSQDVEVPVLPPLDKRKKNKIIKMFNDHLNPFLEKKDVENDLSLIFESSIRRSQRIAHKENEDSDSSNGGDVTSEEEYSSYSKTRKRKRNEEDFSNSKKKNVYD
jgi:hypothetical protein